MMFIYTAKFSKRKVISAALLLTVLLIGLFCLGHNEKTSAPSTLPAGANDQQRVEYLTSLGWDVNSDPVESLSLTLPDPLSEPYLSYNMLQLDQGFDLSPYAGKTLARYTYTINNHPNEMPCQSNLYIYDDQVIAGDIICTGEGGFIAKLAFPNKE